MSARVRAISWAVVAGAPLSIAWLIVRCGVNVAVEDQIDIGAFLVRNHGRFFPSFADLYAQHNESRKFFPRLIFFYAAQLSHWNVKFEMAITWVAACGILAGILLLARRGEPAILPVDRTGGIASPLAALLLFSPVQWWNWLFGIQLVVFLPLVMLVVAMLAVTSPRSFGWRMAIAAVCCLIATYSYANGMVLWVLVGILLFARERRAAFIAAWIVLAGIAVGAYFIGYVKPQVATPAGSALGHPLRLVTFVLAFIGHPLSWSQALAVNAVIGAICVAIFIIVSARARQLPWILLGCYTLVSAGAAAVGRLSFGATAAIEPRYATFAIPIWIAVVMMWSAAAMPALLRTAAITVVITLHALASLAAWPAIRANERDRLLARAVTHYALVLPDQSLLTRLVYPRPAFALPVIAALSNIGYVRPPVVRSDSVSGGVTRGAFEGVLRVGEHDWVLYGWAMLPDGRPADAVLIARDGHVVALSERTVLRPDRPGLGWDLPVTPRLAAPGAQLTAWAYDATAGRAFKLTGSLALNDR